MAKRSKAHGIAKLVGRAGLVRNDVVATFDSDQVVSIVGENASMAVYTTAAELPTSGLTAGNQAFITSTGRLYISNSVGWYNIALINQTPYWTEQPNSDYTLSSTGVSTVITILATDSDGTVPSYTVTADSDFNTIATITTDSEGTDGTRFIITPLDSEGGTAIPGTGTLTFIATDGTNQASVVSTFTLYFGPNYDSIDFASRAATVSASIPFTLGFSTTSYQGPAIMGYGQAAVDYTGEYYILGDHYQPSQSAQGQYGIFRRVGNTLSLMTQVTGQSVGMNNYSYFGKYVGINNNGDVALIFNGGGNLGYRGYITTRTGTTWSAPSHVLTPNWIGQGQGFAHDGNMDRIILQEPYYNSNQGQAHIYTRSGTSFSLEQVIPSPSPVTGGYFSSDFKMNEAGNLVAITEPASNSAGNNYGRIYIFERSNTTWSHTATLHTGNTSNYGGMYHIQMSNDASVIIGIGFQEASNDGGHYVWYRNGASWTNRTTYDQKIISPESPSGVSGGLRWIFGTISPDGKYYWLHKGRVSTTNTTNSISTLYKSDGTSFNLLSPNVDLAYRGAAWATSYSSQPIVFSKDGTSMFHHDTYRTTEIYDG